MIKLSLCLDFPYLLKFYKEDVLNFLFDQEDSWKYFVSFDFKLKGSSINKKANFKHVWKWQKYLNHQEFINLLIKSRVIDYCDFFYQCNHAQLIYIFKYLCDEISFYRIHMMLQMHSTKPFLPNEAFAYIAERLMQQDTFDMPTALYDTFYATAPIKEVKKVKFIKELM